MEQNEKLRALETLQKKLYAYNCASNRLFYCFHILIICEGGFAL